MAVAAVGSHRMMLARLLPVLGTSAADTSLQQQQQRQPTEWIINIGS
jgi:hypothetical protein